MLKRFLGDSAVYGISNIIGRGIVGLLLLPLYTRFLTPEEYGRVDLLQVVRSLAVVIVVLEINQGLVRLLADAKSDDDRTSLASTALWFSIAMYGSVVTAGLLWAEPLSRWLLGTPDAVAAVRVAMLYIATDGLFALLQLQLRFELRPGAYVIASLASLLVAALASVLLLNYTALRETAVLLALACGNVVGALVSLRASRHRFTWRFSRAACALMLAFSAPLVLSSVSGFVATFIDRIVIRQLMGVHEVGVFAVGARIASIGSFAMFGIQMALTPLVYSHHAEPGTPGAIARILRLVLALMLPLVITLGIFAPELIAYVAAPAFLDAARVVPLFALSAFLSQFWLFAPGLGLAKRTHVIALLNVFAALVNTALNYLLVPMWGLTGAAAATLTGSALLAAGYVVLGHRHYPVPFGWGRMTVAAMVAAATCAAAVARWGDVPASGATIWSQKLVTCLIAFGLIVLTLVTRAEIAGARRLLALRPAVRPS